MDNELKTQRGDAPPAVRSPWRLTRVAWATGAIACAWSATMAPGALAQDDVGIASRPSLQKAEDLIGADLHDSAGKEIGEMQDLVIDLRTGNVEYVVVTGEDGKTCAFPPQRIRWNQDDELSLDVSKEQALAYPKFEADNWPARLTGQGEQWTGYGKLADDHQFARASQIIGMDVENWGGETLGKIKDIVIDLDRGTARYAVLTSGGFLGMGEDSFAVRIDRFRHHKGGKNLVLAADPEDFKGAQSLDEDRWPAYADDDWRGSVARSDQGADRHATSRTDPRPQQGRDTDPGATGDEGQPYNPRYTDPWRNEERRNDGRRIEDDPRRYAYPWQDQPPSDADMGDDAWQDDPRNRYDRWLQQERTRRDLGRDGDRSSRNWNDDVVWRVPWYGQTAQPSVYDESYDPAKTQQVSGQVVAIQQRSRSSSPNSYDRSVQVKIKTDDGRHMLVHLGPATFLDRQGFAVNSGDRVEVKGSTAQVEGDQVVIADQLTLNGNSIQLRNPQGSPMWMENTRRSDGKTGSRSAIPSQPGAQPVRPGQQTNPPQGGGQQNPPQGGQKNPPQGGGQQGGG